MPKLTDTEAYDRLFNARRALGDEEGETVRATTALKTARRALAMLQFALLQASEENSDHVEGVIDQPAPLPEPPPHRRSSATD
jgi:hypothetical protein